MAYTPIKKVNINKEIFESIINIRGEHISTLGDPSRKELCSTRCLHDSLKKGIIKESFLTAIAKEINVDRRYLSGEIYEKRYNNTSLDYYLSKINEYPYDREENEKQKIQYQINFLDTILANFNLSYFDYESLNSSKKSYFYAELLKSIRDTLQSYFKIDDNTINSIDYIIQDCQMSAFVTETVLPLYIESPPDGYTEEDIESMDFLELYNLYMFLECGVEPY